MTDQSGGYDAPYGHEEFNFEPFMDGVPPGMVRIGGISYNPRLERQFRPDPAEGARIALRAAAEGREHGHPDTVLQPSAEVAARLNALSYDRGREAVASQPISPGPATSLAEADFDSASSAAVRPAEGSRQIQPRPARPAPRAIAPPSIPSAPTRAAKPASASTPMSLAVPTKAPPSPTPQQRNPWWDIGGWYENLLGSPNPSKAAPSGLFERPLPLSGKVHPTPAGAAPAPSKSPSTILPQVGDLSMFHETGYRPGQEALAIQRVSTGLMSNGEPDPGGVSWGAYQLASRNPSRPGASQTTLNAFLVDEGSSWKGQLTGDPTVRHGEFQSNWLAVAKREPEAFFQAQRAFIARTHYQPALTAVKAKTGVDISSLSPAVQNVAWSMAVQHGKAPTLIAEAVNSLKGVIEPGQAGYDRALINSLYDTRNDYVASLKTKRPGLLNRYARERRDALGMLPKGE